MKNVIRFLTVVFLLTTLGQPIGAQESKRIVIVGGSGSGSSGVGTDVYLKSLGGWSNDPTLMLRANMTWQPSGSNQQQLATPTLSSGTITTNTIPLSWNAVTSASSYTLDWNNGGTWSNLYTGANLSYTHVGLQAVTSYSYRLKATVTSGFVESNYSYGTYTTNAAVSGTNLLASSHNFTQSPWSAANLSVFYGTANGSILAPDGSNDVSLIDPNDQYSGLNYPAGNTVLTNGSQYTLWIDCKASTMTQIQLVVGGNQTSIFTYDLSNSTITNGNSFANGVASIENLQTTLGAAYAGWYRVKLTFTADNPTVGQFDLGTHFPQSATGGGADKFYIWRMQLNPGTTAGTYLAKP